MSKVFQTILLQALPASGKSEVRNFLANVEPKRLEEEFHIGANLQLDDYPYVNFMREIDTALEAVHQPRIFYPSNDKPLIDGRDWATFINLLNEDYHNLHNRVTVHPDSYALYLFERMDRAAMGAGMDARIANLDDDVRKAIAQRLEEPARKIITDLEAQYPDSFDNKTLIIECSRGGKDGSTLPLTGTMGYQFSLPYLSNDLLENAVILYILVTPEQSRAKNFARSEGNTDQSSNLFHGVPLDVMLGDYGCDDMLWLIEHSEVKDTVTVNAHGKTYHLPVGVFDNRVDATSFLRRDKKTWTEDEVNAVTRGIRQATDTMWAKLNQKH